MALDVLEMRLWCALADAGILRFRLTTPMPTAWDGTYVARPYITHYAPAPAASAILDWDATPQQWIERPVDREVVDECVSQLRAHRLVLARVSMSQIEVFARSLCKTVPPLLPAVDGHRVLGIISRDLDQRDTGGARLELGAMLLRALGPHVQHHESLITRVQSFLDFVVWPGIQQEPEGYAAEAASLVAAVGGQS